MKRLAVVFAVVAAAALFAGAAYAEGVYKIPFGFKAGGRLQGSALKREGHLECGWGLGQGCGPAEEQGRRDRNDNVTLHRFSPVVPYIVTSAG
jgi:hypothetical protein